MIFYKQLLFLVLRKKFYLFNILVLTNGELLTEERGVRLFYSRDSALAEYIKYKKYFISRVYNLYI